MKRPTPTMLPRAVALTQGTGLTVVDYLPLSDSATADATGTATVSFDPVAQGYMWLVTGLSVRSNSTGAVRTMTWAGPRLMDGSDDGTFDISDRNSPILVASGEALQLVWTGCVPGSVCTVDGQYQYVLRG